MTRKFGATMARVNQQVAYSRVWKNLKEGVKKSIYQLAAWNKCVEKQGRASVTRAWQAWMAVINLHETMVALLAPFQTWKTYAVSRRKQVQMEATAKWTQMMPCDTHDSASGLTALRMMTERVMVEYLESEISFEYGGSDERFNSVVWRSDRLIGRTLQVALELPRLELERMEAHPGDCNTSIAVQLTEVAKRLQADVHSVLITDARQGKDDLDGTLSAMTTPGELHVLSELHYDPLETYPPDGQISTQQRIQRTRQTLQLDVPVINPEVLSDGEESDELPDLIGSIDSGSDDSDDDDHRPGPAESAADEAENEIYIPSNIVSDVAARARLGRYLYNVATRGARAAQTSLSSVHEAERPKMYVDCRVYMPDVIRRAFAVIQNHRLGGPMRVVEVLPMSDGQGHYDDLVERMLAQQTLESFFMMSGEEIGGHARIDDSDDEDQVAGASRSRSVEAEIPADESGFDSHWFDVVPEAANDWERLGSQASHVF